MFYLGIQEEGTWLLNEQTADCSPKEEEPWTEAERREQDEMFS